MKQQNSNPPCLSLDTLRRAQSRLIVDYSALLTNYSTASKDAQSKSERNWDELSALIEVRVTPQRGMGFDKVAERIYNYPEINAVYLISGGYDLLISLEGKSLKEISMFVSDKLAPLDSILSTATHFILKKYKDHGTVLAKKKEDEREMIIL